MLDASLPLTALVMEILQMLHSDGYGHGSLTLNHLKISRKARNGFIFCQILIFILHVTYKYCIMYLRWHK